MCEFYLPTTTQRVNVMVLAALVVVVFLAPTGNFMPTRKTFALVPLSSNRDMF